MIRFHLCNDLGVRLSLRFHFSPQKLTLFISRLIVPHVFACADVALQNLLVHALVFTYSAILLQLIVLLFMIMVRISPQRVLSTGAARPQHRARAPGILHRVRRARVVWQGRRHATRAVRDLRSPGLCVHRLRLLAKTRVLLVHE